MRCAKLNEWLPPDDVYPGYSLNRLGSTPAAEKEIIGDFLKELQIPSTDNNIEASYKIIGLIITALHDHTRKELEDYEIVLPLRIGTVWDGAIQLAVSIFIGSVIKEAGKNTFESFKNWWEGRKEKKKGDPAVRKLLEVSNEEEIVLERIKNILEQKEPGIFEKIDAFLADFE